MCIWQGFIVVATMKKQNNSSYDIHKLQPTNLFLTNTDS